MSTAALRDKTGKHKRTAHVAVLEQVRKTGEPVLATRHGRPVAEVVPPTRPERARCRPNR